MEWPCCVCHTERGTQLAKQSGSCTRRGARKV